VDVARGKAPGKLGKCHLTGEVLSVFNLAGQQ
jgi:hypothetical protein